MKVHIREVPEDVGIGDAKVFEDIGVIRKAKESVVGQSKHIYLKILY